MNSHIQMPKRFLKRFENRSKSFFYYDVENDFIGKNGHAKSINSSEGYYSDEQEHFLNHYFEQDLPRFFKAIDDINDNPPAGSVDSETESFWKMFVYSLLARERTTAEKLTIIFPQREDPADSIWNDLSVMYSLLVESSNDVLANYGVTVAINRTEIPFVLPQCGTYRLYFMGSTHLFLPISPRRAIAFIEEAGKTSVVKNGYVHPYSILESSTISIMNEQAVRAQCSWKKGYVVSSERQALERAIMRCKQ